MLRYGTHLSVAVAAAALSSAGAARAGSAGCDDRVRVEGDVSALWMDAIRSACAALSGTEGTDPTARVRIAQVDGDLAIEVTLADGRFAARRLRSPENVRATLEALLVVPPRPTAPPPALPHEPAPPAAGETWPSTDEPPRPTSSKTSDATFGIDIGGGVGGRVAGTGYLSLGPSGFGELRVGAWLLGTSIRWEALTEKSAPLVSTFEMETVAAALLVGRRLPLDFGSVDAGISPRLVVETQTYEDNLGEHSDGRTDVRLGAFGRLALGKSALRPALELDAELSPSRLRRAAQIDRTLPALPSWSAGLTAGVTWSATP